MTTWFTADPHFGHARIPELSGRPYGTVEQMDAALIGRWNTRVGHGDRVYVCGDFALGKLSDSLRVLPDLNGEKILVPGNHDRCHPMHKRSGRWRDRYLAAGFADVASWLVIAQVGGRAVQVSHFPPSGDGGPVDRFTDWRPVDTPAGWVIHGHIHTQWRQRGRWINVGVDAWAGAPVPEEHLALIITGGPQDTPPLPWDAPPPATWAGTW